MTHKVHRKFNYKAHVNYSEKPQIHIGKMTKMCMFCKALRFDKETSGICCYVQIKLPEYTSGETVESRLFLKHIRKYNSCFQM